MTWQDNVRFPVRCKPLPPGYRIAQLDSGHYLWTKDDLTEGRISWDRWWVRRCAFEHAAWQRLIGWLASVLLARRDP